MINQPTDKGYLSDIRVTNISKSFTHKMAGRKLVGVDMERNCVTVSVCSEMSRRLCTAWTDATMRRRDVTTLAAVVAVTSLLTSLAAEARELAGAVQYEMAEELAAGTPVGRGMIVDAHLADIYSSSELSQLTFSLVRGLPPDIASHYFTVDQHTGLLRVHTHSLTVRLVLSTNRPCCVTDDPPPS